MAYEGVSIRGFFFSEVREMKEMMNQSKKNKKLKGRLFKEKKQKGKVDLSRQKARKIIREFKILKKGGGLS